MLAVSHELTGLLIAWAVTEQVSWRKFAVSPTTHALQQKRIVRKRQKANSTSPEAHTPLTCPNGYGNREAFHRHNT